jgi:hypothetical protein
MFTNALRANVSARSRIPELSFRSTTHEDVAPIVVRTIGTAVSAAFLIGALALVAMDQPATGGTQWSCTMPAKGGAPCLALRSLDDYSDTSAAQQSDCVSLGRGGRICSEHLRSESREISR